MFRGSIRKIKFKKTVHHAGEKLWHKKKDKNKNSDDNLIDEVGETNVYPVSEMEGANDGAKIHT